MLNFSKIKNIDSLATNIHKKIFNELNDSNLETNLDYALKKLNINLNESNIKDNIFGIFRLVNNRAYITINSNKKLIPFQTEKFIKASCIGLIVYDMFQHDTEDNFNFIFKDDLLSSYLDLESKDKNSKEFFILNFAAMFIVPKYKLSKTLKVGIINKDFLSSLFKTTKLIIDKRLKDIKEYYE